MVFTDAKTVMMNNKEIQSIVLDNGAVLYERYDDMSLTLSYSPSTVYYGDTVALNVTLIGRDVANKTIVLYASEVCFISSEYFTSNRVELITDSNGVVSTNIVCTGFSSLTVTASYNDLSDSVNITVNDKYDLDLVSDKDILSYNDNDTATLTATLTKNRVPINDEIQFISTNVYEKEIHDSGNYPEIGRYFEVDLSNLPVNQSYYIGSDDIISPTIDLRKFQDGTSVFIGNSSEGTVLNDIVYFEDTQLRYVDSQTGNEIIKDISKYDLSKWNKFSVALSADVLVKYPVFYKVGVTDANGQCSVTYDSKGIGDVNIKAEYGRFVSETYEVEDCDLYIDGSIVPSYLSIPSGMSVTSNGDYISITTNTSEEKVVWLPYTVTTDEDYVFETEIAEVGTTQSIALYFDDGYGYHQDGKYASVMGSSRSVSKSVAIGDKYIVTKVGEVITAYINDTQINSMTKTSIAKHRFGYYTNRNRVQKLKNIKIKRL